MTEDLFAYELPEWNEHRFQREDQEGDEWKTAAQGEAAKKLYGHCREIFKLCRLLTESVTGDWAESQRSMIMSNISIIGAKIVGAESGDLYILRMEKAAIIRHNMKELREQLIMMEIMQTENGTYCQVILKEIDLFKAQFKYWVSLFKKDDIEDDWGLFNL